MDFTVVGHDTQCYAMNGGDGPHSYLKNSSYQGGALDALKFIIEEEIVKNFDIKHVPSTMCIADFGCSTGHNSFPAVQIIIDTIKKMQKSSTHHHIPEYYVLFNDVVANDFNTLFSSLPAQRDYLAAGVPGDFHRRLLPSSSLHFAYSSWSLNWLTEAPKAVASRSSPAWNKGRILYSRDRKKVCDAYLQQYEKDMGAFLEARAAEIVEGGLMTLLIPGVPDFWNPQTEYTLLSDIKLLESCLVDMAKKGRVREEKIDSFNVPYYFTTPEQLKAIMQKSQRFRIKRMEVVNNPGKYRVRSVEARAALYRATHEGLLTQHFGPQIIDELFDLYTKKLAASPLLCNLKNDRSIIILVVLKRVTHN